MAVPTRAIAGKRSRIRIAVGLLVFSIVLMALLDRPVVSQVDSVTDVATDETVEADRG